MRTSTSKLSVFGLSSPRWKRLFAVVAIVLCSSLLLALSANLLVEAFRKPPDMADLSVIEGAFRSHGQCGGKGRLHGVDVTLSQGSATRTVRVPCDSAITSLPVGAPLKLHLREVAPLFGSPSYTDLWHATSGDRVVYSYEARFGRANNTRWVIPAVAVGMLLLLVPLMWRLSALVWREATESNEA